MSSWAPGLGNGMLEVKSSNESVDYSLNESYGQSGSNCIELELELGC
jgi:hypothetical protein